MKKPELLLTLMFLSFFSDVSIGSSETGSFDSSALEPIASSGLVSDDARNMKSLQPMAKDNVKVAMLVKKKVPSNQGAVIILVEERQKKPFLIDSYKILLDGKAVYVKESGKDVESPMSLNELKAGKHLVTVDAVYGGTGYGMFEYHSDYIYPVTAEYEVEVKKNKIATVRIIYDDKGGFLSDLRKRPFIRFDISEVDMPVRERVAEQQSSIVKREFKIKKSGRFKLKKIGPSDDFLEPVLRADNYFEPLVVRDGASSGGRARNILGLSAERNSRGARVVIKGDGRFGEYDSFVLKKPSRIVVDIMNVRERLNKDVKNVRSPYLKRVRVGQHKSNARVVLDLPENSSQKYKVKKSGNRLIIEVGPALMSGDIKYLIGLSVEKSKNGDRVILKGDGNFGDYKSFILKKPAKIVVDISGVKEKLNNDTKEVNSAYLKRVRVGQHEDTTRVVLDLPSGSSEKYKVRKSGNRLIIEVGRDL